MTTSAPSAVGSMHALPAISLADLQAEAAFLTRCDRKYLVPACAVGALLANLDPSTRVLEIEGRRSFAYRTPYFDDADLTSYYGAARFKRNRFKVRTRLYADSGLCQLEVKVRDCRGRTVKHRIDHEAVLLEELSDADHAWLRAFPQVEPHARGLRHCVTTHYRRFTLVLPNGAGRVTVDRDLVFALPTGRALAVPTVAIIETKGPGGPTSLDRALWRSGHRPVTLSKFAVGLSLLLPDLPANRWHRTRKRLATVAVEPRTLSALPNDLLVGVA